MLGVAQQPAQRAEHPLLDLRPAEVEHVLVAEGLQRAAGHLVRPTRGARGRGRCRGSRPRARPRVPNRMPSVRTPSASGPSPPGKPVRVRVPVAERRPVARASREPAVVDARRPRRPSSAAHFASASLVLDADVELRREPRVVDDRPVLGAAISGERPLVVVPGLRQVVGVALDAEHPGAGRGGSGRRPGRASGCPTRRRARRRRGLVRERDGVQRHAPGAAPARARRRMAGGEPAPARRPAGAHRTTRGTVTTGRTCAT